jgi:hypothetical protein
MTEVPPPPWRCYTEVLGFRPARLGLTDVDTDIGSSD